MPESSAELLLWTTLRTVEGQTLGRYQTQAPDLLTPAKSQAVQAITALGQGALVETSLAEAVPALLDAAEGQGAEEDALWIQGLLLEHLGITLYTALGQGQRLSPEGTLAAAQGAQASEDVAALATAALRARYPEPKARFQAFIRHTRPVFARLDTLGEAIDDSFAEPMDLCFADLMGDFVADLLPRCTEELGFERRKVMMHLSAAMMG